MSDRSPDTYPPEARTPDGTLWWKLKTYPGTRRAFDDKRKIAAWVAFNVDVGETFTMKDLREALGDTVPNNATNR